MYKNQILTKSKYPFYALEPEHGKDIPGFRFFQIHVDYKPTETLHHHNFWELLIVRKGTGTHYIDFDVHPIQDNQIFCIRRGQLHKIVPTSPLEGWFIMFDDTFFSHMFQNKAPLQAFSSSTQCSFPLTTDIQDQMCALQKTILKPYHHQTDILAAQLKILLLLLEELAEKTHPHVITHPLSTQFFTLLDGPTLHSRFVKDYAAPLHISTNYLNEVIKKQTGKSAQDWIKNRVLLEAKRHLIHATESIETISKKLLFLDAASFCRFFKTKEGISPHQWACRKR